MTPDEKRTLRHHMQMPGYAFAALLALLGVNVVLDALLPARGVWTVEAAVALTMVLIVLLFSMEVVREPPLIRLFSGLGFFWVFILFTLTLTDYFFR